MIYFALFFLTIFLCYLIVRMGAIALKFCGIPEKDAFFESLSAFTRTGFTTKTSSIVLRDPVIRRLIMALMILGNTGVVSVFITLVNTVHLEIQKNYPTHYIHYAFILLIFFMLMRISIFPAIQIKIESLIQKFFEKKLLFRKVDYDQIMFENPQFSVRGDKLETSSPYSGKTLKELDLKSREIIVLAIEGNEGIINIPDGNITLPAGKQIVCYGRTTTLENDFFKKTR